VEKTKDMPIWVFLAFSSIETRKGAMWLIYACIGFTLYCIPWSLIASESDWVETIFLIDDWSWLAMMVPISGWYWLSLKWVDKNTGWNPVETSEDQ